MPYRASPNFRKVLQAKPHPMQAAIARCLAKLEADPLYPGLHVRKVQAAKGVFEVRIDGGNRLTFHWEAGVKVLRNNCNHQAVYRSP